MLVSNEMVTLQLTAPGRKLRLTHAASIHWLPEELFETLAVDR